MIEGKVLSEMRKVWKETAVSESRINLIAELIEKKLGFNEIEKFSLGLVYSLKSEKLRDRGEQPVRGVVEAALRVKHKDEVEHCKELKRKRDHMKIELGRKHHHPRSRKYKTIVEFLRREAWNTKQVNVKKYEQKIKELMKKYRKEEEDEEITRIPTGMERLTNLSIFSKEKYSKIKKDEVEVPIVGETELSDEERALLKRNPKFAIPDVIEENLVKEEMERALASSEWSLGMKRMKK